MNAKGENVKGALRAVEKAEEIEEGSMVEFNSHRPKQALGNTATLLEMPRSTQDSGMGEDHDLEAEAEANAEAQPKESASNVAPDSVPQVLLSSGRNLVA